MESVSPVCTAPRKNVTWLIGTKCFLCKVGGGLATNSRLWVNTFALGLSYNVGSRSCTLLKWTLQVPSLLHSLSSIATRTVDWPETPGCCGGCCTDLHSSCSRNKCSRWSLSPSEPLLWYWYHHQPSLDQWFSCLTQSGSRDQVLVSYLSHKSISIVVYQQSNNSQLVRVFKGKQVNVNIIHTQNLMRYFEWKQM